MYDSCFENLEMVASGHSGSGCLLAHCMGLGKTLQVISLLHTLLAHGGLTKIKRVIVMLPINVQTNWASEVKKWTKPCKSYKMKVFQLPTKKDREKVGL